MEFATAEKIFEYQQSHAEQYSISMSQDGLHLLLKDNPSQVVAFVKDDRAPILAMEFLKKMCDL